MDKGQVTVFIIIGLLVVVSFAMTVYVGSKMRQGLAQKEVQVQSEKRGVEPMKEYISSCLNLAVTQGLRLAGAQGGVIYASQGGISQDPKEGEFISMVVPDVTDLGMLKIPYVIVPPQGDVGTLFYSQPPTYPFDSFPYGDGKLLFTGYYGVSRFPPLYKLSPQGEQVPGSLQESLEHFIGQKTASCVNWQAFEEKGYELVLGAANASLVFAEKQDQFVGEQFIAVELSYPVEVTTPGRDKVLLKEFSTKVNVRLATMYYTVKQLIDADVTDVSYVSAAPQGFQVARQAQGSDSIILVNDTLSNVGGKPFEFVLARKDRIPALWRIDLSPFEKVMFHVTDEGRGAKFIVEGNKLLVKDPCPDTEFDPVIELNASDPDEDVVSFAVTVAGSQNNEIPRSAIGQGTTLTVFAKDSIVQGNDGFDYQMIPLKVALCVKH